MMFRTPNRRSTLSLRTLRGSPSVPLLLLLAACGGRYELGEVEQSLDLTEPDTSTKIGRVIIDELADLGAPLSRRSEGSAGDVDGDGFDDWFASTELRGVPGEFDVRLVFGGPREDGDPYREDRLGPIVTYESASVPAPFWYPEAAGDLDGDGHADVLVSAAGMASHFPEAESSFGPSFLEHWAEQRAYVSYGGPRGSSTGQLRLSDGALPFAPIESIRTGFASELALETDAAAEGWSLDQRTTLTRLGDLDSDGIDDFAYTHGVRWQGMKEDQSVQAFTGSDRREAVTYVYYGGPTRLSADGVITSAALELPGVTAIDRLGDVDGDGRPELVMTKNDVVYVTSIGPERLTGTVAAELVATALLTAFVKQPDGVEAYREVVGVGDIDVDGFDDLLVRLATNTVENATYLYYGGPERLEQPLLDESASATFPEDHVRTLQNIGDWNGDGLDDLLAVTARAEVGSADDVREHTTAVLIPGRSARYTGLLSAGSLDAAPDGRALNGMVYAKPLGDIDGDGLTDLEFVLHGEGTFIGYGAPLAPVIY